VTKSAFFQARKQLSHTALIDLNRIVTDGFYASYDAYRTWNGFRLCAVDGSMIRLPREADVVNEFGVHTGKANQSDCPMGLASLYFDVLNHLVIDASLNPVNASERACAARHLAHAQPNDLVIYDRGYNAFWLYATHRERRLAFCMRAKVKRGVEFKRFVESGAQHAIVTLRPNKRSVAQCIEHGVSAEPVRLRLVRVDLPSEVEVLITNLMDETVYDAAQFKALYHQRWGCEENYKRFKHWVEIENSPHPAQNQRGWNHLRQICALCPAGFSRQDRYDESDRPHDAGGTATRGEKTKPKACVSGEFRSGPVENETHRRRADTRIGQDPATLDITDHRLPRADDSSRAGFARGAGRLSPCAKVDALRDD